MTTLEIILVTIMAVALLILMIYTIIFLVVLIKGLKQVRIAAEKVQDSADSAAELVDEVRRTVVNPGIIAVMIEKYLHKASKRRKGE